MFAIRKVLQNKMVLIPKINMSSLSIYDIQEFTIQEPCTNKEKPTNVFHEFSRNIIDNNNNLTPKEVLLMQEECIYFRASPKYGSYKTNK